MNVILAATKFPLSTLLTVGAAAALLIIAWSYTHWRAAVKVAFVAVLIEGAIRKWLLPQGQELVYFLKDVFLVGAYIRFYFAPDPELRALRLRIPTVLIWLLVALVSFGALNPNINSTLLAVYGYKIYFFYLPLTFMMPYLYRTQQELVRQLTWYALLAIPICLLGILQWRSGIFSVMNTYAGGSDEIGATTFGFGDKARITGTFSYLTGHTTFVIFFGTLHLALLSLTETRWKWVLLGISLPLLAGNALMGGSRASIVTLAFVTVGFAIGAVSGKIGSSKNFLGILVSVILFSVVGISFMFTDAWAQWSARYQVAGDSMKSRIIEHPLLALQHAFDDGGAFGFGIGTAHPATEAIRQKLRLDPVKTKVPVYDNELGQVLVELGAVGFVSWYLLRAVLFWLAWTSYLRSPPGPVRALCLAGVLVTGPFLLMSVVFNHTANFFIFGLAGFSLIPLLEPVVTRRHMRGSVHAAHVSALPRQGRT